MRNDRWGMIGILGFGALTQCANNAELAPAQAPAPVAATPATTTPVPAANATAAAAPSTAVPVAAAPAPTPESYPMCGGQRLAASAPPPRSGAVTVQLAPAFLDEMPSCKTADALPKDVLSRAGEGSIDAKGDCVFASVGVSCHYHSGSEFITSSTKEEPVGQGEVHCIFPSDDPKSPRVFGAHVTCSDPSRGKPPAEQAAHAAHAAHEAKTGAACSAGLITELASCQSSKCCDDGTLTGAIAELTHDGKNDVRPDFRICEQTLTIDCSLLENMSAHTANAPGLGGIGKPVFAVGAPSSKPGAKDTKAHATEAKAHGPEAKAHAAGTNSNAPAPKLVPMP